jgi:uncharacterized membrane protein YphA (DoxX/SURF4 family)
MASALTPTGRNFPAWPKYALRITFGVIWLIDAVLKWLPGFRSGYIGMISGAGQGQPGWLRPWFSFWTNLQSPHPTVYAYIVAILETLVAVAVLTGFARKLTYITAAAFSVVIWAAAEGFGGPYTSGASDIGTAIIYALVFMCLLTLAGYTGTDTYSLDHYLERKISWWWKVAEVGRPGPGQLAAATVSPAPATAPASATADLRPASAPAAELAAPELPELPADPPVLAGHR